MIPSGRVLLEEEMDLFAPDEWRDELNRLIETGKAFVIPAVDRLKKMCNRCGGNQLESTICGSCNQVCFYCSSCLQMGRSKVCTPLYFISDTDEHPIANTEILLKWNGHLTPAQEKASEAARELVTKSGKKLLIWAVCGAGKTEVTFQPIEQALQLGQKVLLVTPRKDVVLELLPRIEQAFPSVKVIALHGKSKEKWEEAAIIISTTHQALRFYQKFHLVVIDEVDAFPYHNNPMLYYAVERARKPQGNVLYLSATPPAYLRKIPQVRIPARYHRYPLAVPHLLIHKLKKSVLNNSLKEIVEYMVQNDRQGFIFVPYIELVDDLVNQLNKFADVKGTHSRDQLREEKVIEFRNGKTKILVTTTILERGVTVPKTDVVVFQADSPLFDEASLVQMSGRAGRSLQDPVGSVVFIAESKTREMKKAIKHIKQMNSLAMKRGLIDRERT